MKNQKMWFVTKEGKRVDVEIPVEWKDYGNAFQQVGLYSDCAKLEKKYLVSIFEMDFSERKRIYNFTAEQLFNEYPTENEMTQFLAENKLGRGDIVTVTECYEFVFDDEKWDEDIE
jgi:hypothetical protein